MLQKLNIVLYAQKKRLFASGGYSACLKPFVDDINKRKGLDFRLGKYSF